MRRSDSLQAQLGYATRWLDSLLLGGIAISCLAACLILGIIAWQAPEAVRAASRPIATQVLLPASTPVGASLSTVIYRDRPTTVPVPSTEAPPSPISPTATATHVVPGDAPAFTILGRKHIRLDLSEQTLAAYEGDTVVLSALVSTGVLRHPTPIGEYKILRKVRIQAMSGPDYYVPDVEYVSYFLAGYAIHATYWHDNFGHPMSHGCVNMRTEDAKWIYEWAPVGTPLIISP